MATAPGSLRIAFISSALSPEGADDRESFDFFAVLLSGIVRNAQTNGHRVSVYVPQKHGPKISDQGDLIAEVLKSSFQFDAIVIAPFEIDTVKRELQKHVPAVISRDKGEVYVAKPLIFVDKMIDLADIQSSFSSSFSVQNVTCSQYEGGYKAAGVLVKALAKLPGGRKNQKILILRGLQGDEQRVAGFNDFMSANASGVHVVEINSPKLNFTRPGARDWMDEELEHLRHGRHSVFGKPNGRTNWGIFATNDEMALGIRSVIAYEYQHIRDELAMSTQSSQEIGYNSTTDILKNLYFLQNIRIVGFDGIAPVVDLIKTRERFRDRRFKEDRWLVGTIRAEVEQQTEKAIELIEILVNNPHKNTATPEIVPVEVISC